MATFSDFRDEVILSLGGTLVDVELEDSDIAVCFKKAKRIFKQRGNNGYRRQYVRLDVTTDTRTYDLPAETNVVTRVVSPSGVNFSSADAFTTAAYNELFVPRVGATCGGFDLLTYELSLQLHETLNRYSVQDIEHDFDEFTKKLTFLGTPKRAGAYFVEAYMDLTDEEMYDIDWIVRWTIAEAKIVLGTAYRKFSALASPQGDSPIGGPELIADGQREKELLEEEILNFVDGHHDFMGVVLG